MRKRFVRSLVAAFTLMTLTALSCSSPVAPIAPAPSVDIIPRGSIRASENPVYRNVLYELSGIQPGWNLLDNLHKQLLDNMEAIKNGDVPIPVDTVNSTVFTGNASKNAYLVGTASNATSWTTPASSAGAVAGTNVTVEEIGNSVVHKTVLTLAATPITLTDEPGVVLYGGLKIYDFPAGAISLLGAVADLDVAVGGNLIATADGDVGLGTATAGNDDAFSGQEDDIIKSTSIPQLVSSAGPANALTAPADLENPEDGTSTAVDLFLNFLWDDADHDGGTMTAFGTITLVWTNCGDF